MPFPVLCLIYVVGLALIFVELFIPGGFVGFIGTVVVITSVVLTFSYHPPTHGAILVILSFLIIPSMIVWSIRRVTLTSTQNIEEYVSAAESENDLLGKEGVTLTILRPSGLAKIDGQRVDVIAENVIIEKDTPVKVVKVEGNQVIVKSIV